MKKIGAIICIAFVTAVMLATLGCGGDGTTTTTTGMTPSQVTDKYLRASIDRDADTAYALLSEADKANISLEEMREEAELDISDIDFTYELGEETINGDEATVEVTVSIENVATGESEELTETMNLVKEDGEWKIYLGDNL